MDLDLDDFESMIGIANSYYLLEKYENAIPFYEDSLQYHEDEDVEFNLGNCYFFKKETDLAITHYELAL